MESIGQSPGNLGLSGGSIARGFGTVLLAESGSCGKKLDLSTYPYRKSSLSRFFPVLPTVTKKTCV
jgi:hypothetical protein